MSTAGMMERTTKASPGVKARIAGAFYFLVFLTGSLALVFVRGRIVANVVSTAFYVAVVLLFYDLFQPVSRKLSLLAASVGLAGCVFGTLCSFRLAPFQINPLAIFGVYCLLIGYLIWRSTVLPRALGALMLFGGLGWLTFASPQLARELSPYNFAPGIIGEGVLTLWLLVKGVNERRWKEQAGAAANTDRGAVRPHLEGA